MIQINKKRFFLILTLLNLSSLNLFAVEEPISKVDISISMKKSIIEDMINEQLPTTIEDSGSGSKILEGKKNNVLAMGLDLLGSVDKKYSEFSKAFVWAYQIDRKPIFFDANGQEIQAKTNFSGIFKANWEEQSEGAQINISGVAGLKSNIIITPNWNLKANSTPILNISDSNLPLVLNIFGMKLKTDININQTLENKITSKLNFITQEIDKKIALFNLNEIVTEYYKKIADPILIEPDYNIWLTVSPLSASYSNIVSNDTNLGIKVGSNIKLHMYVGEKPNFNNQVSLPPINFGFVKDNFSILLPISSTYSDLNTILNKNLPQQEYKVFTGITAQAENITLSYENESVIAKSNFNIKIFNFFKPTGTINISLKPTFDSINETFTGDDFNYSLETNSYLLKILNKLFGNTIKEKIIKNYLTFNTSDDMQNVKKLLQSKVENIEVEKDIFLKTDIENLKITALNLDEENLSIVIQIIGSSTLEILDLKK